MTDIATTLPLHAIPDSRQQEVFAVQTAMTGGIWARTKLALSAMRKLMADPEDTQQVFIMSMTLNARALPHMLERFLHDDSGLKLLEQRAAIDSQAVDFDALRALPETTLGGAYVRFLDHNKLDANTFQAPPGMPKAASYLVQRLRQTHDLWHVLTGYNTDIAGELPLLAFTYAQTGAPSMGLIAIVGSFRHFAEVPDIFARIYRGYRRGKAAVFLGNVMWESMWSLPLTEVRQQVGVS